MASSRDAIRRLIRAEIVASGRTQADVAEAAGITPKHMSQIVQGKVGASLDVVDRLLGAVGRELVLSTRPASIPEGRADRWLP